MKQCNWCKSQVDKDAKMCPNCGKAIWEKKHIKGVKKVGIVFGILFLTLFVVIIVLALNTPSAEEYCTSAKFVNLEEVYELHAQNVPKAEELYKDKYFKFTGEAQHIYKSYLQIQSDYISADVYFNSFYQDKSKALNINDKVTYCGKIDFGMSIQVKNSIIVEE
mgnify:CR=1 FL=1